MRRTRRSGRDGAATSACEASTAGRVATAPHGNLHRGADEYACSLSTLRYRLGTARLHARLFARKSIGRARRYPTSAPIVPRPPRPRGRRTLRLTHALVASDLNPLYLDFWPLVRRAWSEVTGLEAVLVLIARTDDVPEHLQGDPAVVVFEPLPGVHTAFQAQCIRLLYPALVEGDGVITSDADMVPMNRRYFWRPVSRIADDHFVSYRDVYLASREITMCYNAAAPRTWGAVFGVSTADDVRDMLATWAEAVEYAGHHGGAGWLTDQQLLYRTLVDYGSRSGKVWILDDHFTGYRRLERALLLRQGNLEPRDRRLIARGAYSDFHCVQPYGQFRELNDLAVDLAIEGIRLRKRRFRLGAAAAGAVAGTQSSARQ